MNHAVTSLMNASKGCVYVKFSFSFAQVMYNGLKVAWYLSSKCLRSFYGKSLFNDGKARRFNCHERDASFNHFKNTLKIIK